MEYSVVLVTINSTISYYFNKRCYSLVVFFNNQISTNKHVLSKIINKIGIILVLT